MNKQIVLRILKENKVIIGPSGRRFTGGREVSMKKYELKPETKERKSKNHKKWSKTNREHLNKYHKEWREKNIDKHRKNKRDYEKTRKHNDPLYKLINNFRTAIYQVLKENNLQKNGHYFEILKYSPEQLIEHLENQFKDGMNWGNTHMDHKIPLTWFSINTPPNIVNHLFNIQPLSMEENISKLNRYSHSVDEKYFLMIQEWILPQYIEYINSTKVQYSVPLS